MEWTVDFVYWFYVYFSYGLILYYIVTKESIQHNIYFSTVSFKWFELTEIPAFYFSHTMKPTSTSILQVIENV